MRISGVELGLSNGTAVTNAAGTGPGTIDLLGQSEVLEFYGNTTFDNATIALTDRDYIGEFSNSGGPLTFGPNAVINVSS